MSAPESPAPRATSVTATDEPLPLSLTDSVVVARPPGQVWAAVADVSRHGEWSPVCTGGAWDEGDGPVVGARFTGYNSADGRTWETRSVVVAAEPGVELAWQVNEDWVRWGFTTRPVDGDPGSTVLTESWEFLPGGLAGFRARGEKGEQQIRTRARQAHDGVPATLAAIKAIVEAGSPT